MRRHVFRDAVHEGDPHPVPIESTCHRVMVGCFIETPHHFERVPVLPNAAGRLFRNRSQAAGGQFRWRAWHVSLAVHPFPEAAGDGMAGFAVVEVEDTGILLKTKGDGPGAERVGFQLEDSAGNPGRDGRRGAAFWRNQGQGRKLLGQFRLGCLVRWRKACRRRRCCRGSCFPAAVEWAGPGRLAPNSAPA